MGTAFALHVIGEDYGAFVNVHNGHYAPRGSIYDGAPLA